MPVEATLCKVVDLKEIPLRDAAPLRFRIEVRRLHDSETYDAVVYRLESFKLTTSFDRNKSGAPMLADHQIFVVDDFLDGGSFVSSSADETIRRVEDALWAQLTGSRNERPSG